MKNKMKITILSVGLLALGMLISGKKEVRAERSSLTRGSDANYYTTVYGSSLTFSSSPIVVYSIQLSSGNGTDFAVLFDTVAPVGMTGPTDAMLNPVRASVAIVFSSNPMSGSVSLPLANNVISFGEAGRRLSRGAFLFKSAAQSGEANIATVEWGF